MLFANKHSLGVLIVKQCFGRVAIFAGEAAEEVVLRRIIVGGRPT